MAICGTVKKVRNVRTVIANTRYQANSMPWVSSAGSNKRSLDDYFQSEQDRRNVMAPLIKSEKQDSVDVTIHVHGGGITGFSVSDKGAHVRLNHDQRMIRAQAAAASAGMVGNRSK